MKEHRWSLAAIESDGGDRAVALLPSGDVVPIDVLPEGIAPLDVFRRWGEFAPLLQGWQPDLANRLEGARIVAPIRYPGKVLCIGVNFPGHREEANATQSVEGEVEQPFFFFKPPTTGIVGPEDDIMIRGPEDNIDWEAEIGIVIGKGGRFIKAADAFDHIAGYTLLNDISARALIMQPGACHPAVAYDWVAHKGQDTFCPTGPGVVPSWFIDNPDDIPFSLTLNGVEEQNGNTRDLVRGIAEIVSAASEYMTLEPGDIVASGTCEGVGLPQQRFMKDGDVVVVSSPLIGSLRNTVRTIVRSEQG